MGVSSKPPCGRERVEHVASKIFENLDCDGLFDADARQPALVRTVRTRLMRLARARGSSFPSRPWRGQTRPRTTLFRIPPSCGGTFRQEASPYAGSPLKPLVSDTCRETEWARSVFWLVGSFPDEPTEWIRIGSCAAAGWKGNSADSAAEDAE